MANTFGAVLEVINHKGEKVPIPKFAMMARWMKDYEPTDFEVKRQERVEN